ncbi:hypothetical protein D9758_005863 [Tetrapyrgos nigripes]|uniref:DUF6535 domain-containing protein n=1 Tax=Tetrapyrgos nigripes TaxID=182062 RepID=A0A8H5G311_9AGAR|nr:hypothetical protein D9758_005863 [Tetrapyrgos nigripes]
MSSFRRVIRKVFGFLFSPLQPGDLESRSRNSTSSSSATEPFSLESALDSEASTKFWSIYIDEAQRYDEPLLKGWKEDMDGMLLFSALYSASLTAFIIESYKTLQDDPAQNTIALLAQISLQFSAALNGTSLPVQSSPPFEPPASALICNMMWFLSLALALTCSLLATFVQQWTRDFIHKTNLRPSPVRQARAIAFLYCGLRDFGMHSFVDLIPILLHVSLLFFFGGLVGFLYPVNRALTYMMACVLGGFLAIYLALTSIPVLYLDAPYRTPLSSALWRFKNAFNDLFTPRVRRDETLTEAILLKSERTTERDKEAVIFTMKSLTDDKELLPFVEAMLDAITPPSLDASTTAPFSPGLYVTNAELIKPLFQTSDPEVNIVSRLVQLMLKSSTWTDPSFRDRSSSVCPRALWALAYMLTQGRLQLDNTHVQTYRNFIQSIFSKPLHFLVSLKNEYMYSAFAAARLSWVHSIRNSVDQVEEILMKREPPHSMTPEQLRRSFILAQEVWDGIEERPSLHTQITEITASGYEYHLVPYMHLVLALKEGSVSVDPSRQFAKIELILSQIQEEVTWKTMRLHVLLEYLVLSVDLVSTAGILPYQFQATCDAIYPHAETTMVDIGGVSFTGPLLHLNECLVKGSIKPGIIANTVILECMRLFFSLSTSLSEDKDSKACRSFTLWYFCKNADGGGLLENDDVGRKSFSREACLRVGDCVFKTLRDGADAQTASLVLEAICLSLCCSNLQFWMERDFPGPLELWHSLRSAHSTIQVDKDYLLVKNLVDQAILHSIVYSDAFNDAHWHSRPQTEYALLQDYLPEKTRVTGPSSRQTSHRDSLMVAIVSKWIDLSRTYHDFHNKPFQLSQTYVTQSLVKFKISVVDISSQRLFTDSVSKLFTTLKSGVLQQLVGYRYPDEFLSDILGRFQSMDWFTSPACAIVLLEAIHRYKEGKVYFIWDAQERLLSRCRDVLDNVESTLELSESSYFSS